MICLPSALLAAAVDGFGDQFVHADRLRVLQRVVVLHPGQVDELLDQAGQPGRLVLHPAGEALHRLGVVGRVHHRLRQQGERADRGLQLVADVRHEVAAHRLDPAGLRQVLDQQEHQPGAQRGDPCGDREGLTPAGAAARQIQLDLAYLAVPAGVPGHLEHRVDGQLAAAHQPEGVRRGAGLDHRVALVQHDGGGAQHGQDGVHARRQHRVGVQ